MKVIITEDNYKMGKKAAEIIAKQIRKKPDSVLGLPTGSTPLSMYQELVRLHKEEGLDFSQVITFNLDEYYPIKKDNPQSYHSFMWRNFFRYVNINSNNVHIPDGELKRADIKKFCKNYEGQIKAVGGIDIMVLGIGGAYYNSKRQLIGGHIGFNEAGSATDSGTRLVKLAEKTRLDNSRFFPHIEDVPHYAITMGLGTITEARRIILMASGDHKASIIQRVVEREPTISIPASILQKHLDVTVILDKGAASRLSRVMTPWLFRKIDWQKELSKAARSLPNLADNAVTLLSINTRKAISELTLKDYQNNKLTALINQYNYKKLAEDVIRRLKSKIKSRRELPSGKKIIVLSPHPDDDVISLGGTLKYLKENDNKIKILYMVSGSTAVRDKDVIEFLKKSGGKKTSPRTFSSKELWEIKAKIREKEAMEATKTLGISKGSLVFLRSPFYETGIIQKAPITDSDIIPLKRILKTETLDIIIVPGEITDPHGTHGKCIKIFQRALKESKLQKPVEIWYYKGGWEEYFVYEADIIVLLSKAIMKTKIKAVLCHKTQLVPVFPGLDPRPFWKRVRDRNQYAAKTLKILGVASSPYAEMFKKESINSV